MAFATLIVASPVADSDAATGQYFGFNEWVNPDTFAIQREINAPVRRFNVGWDGVQAAGPSTWDWTDYDSQYNAVVGAGLRPLIVAVGSPCWSRPGTPCTGASDTWQPPDPAHDSAWALFMRRLAARYPAAVAIEIWNEQNMGRSFQPHVDPKRYTELLTAAYGAVKAANPAMPVISGGLAAADGGGGWGLGDAEFLEQMYAAGAKGAMDGIGIHPYLYAGGTSENDPARYDPMAIRAPLDRLRAAREAAGDQATPLWITEGGESTATQEGYPPAATESQQATDLVAVVRQVKAMPDVRALIIHRLSDIPASGGLWDLLESGFGVVSGTGVPKAAACALSGEFGGTLPCLTVLPNLPAFALPDSAILSEDAAATRIDVLANDVDVDGGSKTIQAKTDGAHGVVTIAADGSHLFYTPDPDYCGDSPSADRFTYTLVGGSQATVYVRVTCVDDPSVAIADAGSIDEDNGTFIDVLANDTDIDGGIKKVDSTTDAAHGSVTVAAGGGSVIYAPQANYCNTDQSGPGSGPKDSFTYTTTGGSTAAVSMAVVCVDDPPVAIEDGTTATEDTPAPIDVLANDTDVDGGPKTVKEVTDGAHGKVTIAPGGSSLTYTPDPDYCSGPGWDAFTYTLAGGSKTAVYVRVTCVDDSAVAVADAATVDEDNGTFIDVLANDTGSDGGAITIRSKTDAAHGTVTIAGGGSGLLYKPGTDYCNDAQSGPGAGPEDTFTYTLSSGSTASVSVVVRCLDDPPLARDDTVTVAEDSPPVLIDVLSNDTDSDGGTKAVRTATQAVHGSVSVAPNGDALLYRPRPDYCNTAPSGPGSGAADAYSYTLSGSSSATVRVAVTCEVPSTAITATPPRRTTSRKARFTFDSDTGGGFTCRLDGAIRACGRSLVVRVSPGRHRLEVWVTDSTGKADLSPAVFQWLVKRKRA